MRTVLIAALFAVLASCVSEDNKGQDFGNILNSPEGIILTEEDHPDGWMREDCYTCHPLAVIHQEDRSGTGLLPIEDIQEFVLAEGLASCPICHGFNGIEELEDGIP